MRVNWALSDEAKAIFEDFKREKGCIQDEAANAMILEFKRLRDSHITLFVQERANELVAIDSKGDIIKATGPLPIGYAIEDSKPCPDGKHHSGKVKL
jgi:hypothetical protein